jgi:elongation factor Ts
MANFTAADVKKLRDLTGAGMMDVKKALDEAEGDFDKATELLRIKGAKDVGKRAGRTAANGLVAHSGKALLEINCETDFVAKNEQFQQLAADIVAHAAKTGTGDVTALLAETLADGRTVQENIDSVASVIGEKLELTAVVVLGAEGRQVASYMHRRSSDLPAQVGVLVEFEGSDLEAARAAAMQVAAMRPQFVTRDEVPADVVENERRLAEETAREEGKPEQALPRIVEGRVNGFFKEHVLLEQPFAKENKKTVSAVLAEAGVGATDFARFRVGA